ncbi:MAG: GNAT family N-acetyltransferase [Deinococcota bacterium]
MTAVAPQVTVRKATPQDIPVLAQIDYEASLPPLNHCFWEDLLVPTGTPVLEFLETMFRLGASNWGSISDFILLEQADNIVAGCAVYTPTGRADDAHPLRLDKLPDIAQHLGWSQEVMHAFETAYPYQGFPEDDLTAFLKPQVDAIIETVAVLPEFRGQGLGKTLIQAALQEAKTRGASSAGIMVLHGNDNTKALYERFFEPYMTFHSAFFKHEFPAITKYRTSLSST